MVRRGYRSATGAIPPGDGSRCLPGGHWRVACLGPKGTPASPKRNRGWAVDFMFVAVAIGSPACPADDQAGEDRGDGRVQSRAVVRFTCGWRARFGAGRRFVLDECFHRYAAVGGRV